MWYFVGAALVLGFLWLIVKVGLWLLIWACDVALWLLSMVGRALGLRS